MALEYYKYINNYTVDVHTPTIPEEKEAPSVLPLSMSDAKDITLASFDANTKDLITAHQLKDYRRKTFTLLLLPDVDIMYDQILKGVYELL